VRWLLAAALAAAGTIALAADPPVVWVSEGSLAIPTYEHSARELEPALFPKSTVTGMYPFTTYLLPFKADGPLPHTYAVIYVENEYLKLTYIPEFGGRIFSLYDKIRGREVFYRNDVIKPAPYNPRNSWPQSGLELTGPHDLHMLTLHSEPYWSNVVVRNPDGSVTLALGETDPVYGMEVQLSATLHPGVAALEIGVRCYNGRPARMPQMLWINTAINATPKTRFIYPMSRTVGHTTADIADWPLYNGLDYSWDRNNTHMLGVFGIDSYGNYLGAYQFDRDYGIFRYGDRRVVQGGKLWTFGYGESAKTYEAGYTDKAGPYVELQSGRYVWDGHYEWVEPHKTEGWSEWWMPVAATDGLTTLSRDVALHIEMPQSGGAEASLALAVTRKLPGATVTVQSRTGELLKVKADLDPARTFRSTFPMRGEPAELVVRVTAADGQAALEYHRPDAPPGRKEYTPFTSPLERPRKAPADMSVEELVLAGEYRQKELDDAGAAVLFNQALQRDPGCSRAHLQLGIQDYQHARFEQAAAHLEKAIDRDPYSAESYYYLALSQLALGRETQAERNFYFIGGDSGFYGAREYQLGRLELLRKELDSAVRHFEAALRANSDDLDARVSLALALSDRGDQATAAQELQAAGTTQPSSRLPLATRFLLTNDTGAKAELLRMLDRQSQEALAVSQFFRDLRRWSDAVRILSLVEVNNADPFGTSGEFYYTLAYCQRRTGDDAAANASLAKARLAARNVDRFPSRLESVAPLEEALKLNARDSYAHYLLGCLLYHFGREAEAVAHWQDSVAASPQDFSAHRALGLALAQRGEVDQAAAQLRRAIELNPAHVRTLNDLSNLYARAGRFDEQLTLLKTALARSPKDDDLAEGVFTAYLLKGQYAEAELLIAQHTFSPRHRSYGLRDKYRLMRYAQGSQALNHGDFPGALKLYEASAHPPVSLGVDDFAAQTSPRQQYYLGRAYDALGRKQDAQAAYSKAIQGVEQLSGDRDSWSSENYFMVLSLDRLGRTNEAVRLQKHFADFGLSEVNDQVAQRRAEACYVLALVRKHDQQTAEALKLLRDAIDAQPDLLAAQIELRGEAPDPLRAGNSVK
jgi:tetratricopeptide (TPR) repeat protein